MQRQTILNVFTQTSMCLCQNETKSVKMMYQMKKLPYNYIPDYKVQILELPYAGEELSMFILLPEKGTSLGKVMNLQINIIFVGLKSFWFYYSHSLGKNLQ